MVDVTHTIYRNFRSGHDADSNVGITIAPTPSLTYSELLDLIAQLNRIAREMDGRA